MNVGFLPRALPTMPIGRPSVGLKRSHSADHATPADAASAPTPDEIVAAGPRKRRRSKTLHVDLRPAATPATATPVANLAAALTTLWAQLVALVTTAGARIAPLVSSARAHVAPLANTARTRLQPLTAAIHARTGSTTLPGPLANISFSAIARIDRRVLAILGVLGVATLYAVTFADPPSVVSQTAAREALPAGAAKSSGAAGQTGAAASDTPALPANPFAQASINTELRALRKAVQPGDQVRNLTVLADGTMGMEVVNGSTTANVMVRGQDIAIEPLAAESDTSGATLDLKRVHGTAITRILDEAATTHALPKAKLASLRLLENSAKPGTFIWIGVWNDPARTTLYADREAQTVAPTRPR